MIDKNENDNSAYLVHRKKLNNFLRKCQTTIKWHDCVNWSEVLKRSSPSEGLKKELRYSVTDKDVWRKIEV